MNARLSDSLVFVLYPFGDGSSFLRRDGRALGGGRHGGSKARAATFEIISELSSECHLFVSRAIGSSPRAEAGVCAIGDAQAADCAQEQDAAHARAGRSWCARSGECPELSRRAVEPLMTSIERRHRASWCWGKNTRPSSPRVRNDRKTRCVSVEKRNVRRPRSSPTRFRAGPPIPTRVALDSSRATRRRRRLESGV